MYVDDQCCDVADRLGKTIQTIARIVEGRPKKSDKEDGWSPSTLYVFSPVKTMVPSFHDSVICPVSLVSQWASEIKKMTEKLVVIEHHGQSRTIGSYLCHSNHKVHSRLNASRPI